MTQYIAGKTVFHPIEHLDHKHNHAKAKCGVEGTPVEANPDKEEICRRCEPAEEEE